MAIPSIDLAASMSSAAMGGTTGDQTAANTFNNSALTLAGNSSGSVISVPVVVAGLIVAGFLWWKFRKKSR